MKWIKRLLMKYHLKRAEYWDKQWWETYSIYGKGYYEQNYNYMIHKQKADKLKEKLNK